MHKKMIAVSDELHQAEARTGPAALTEARRQLYRAQCNCSYWHGLFGGLYLNYLRDTVYHRLIDAELVAENALGLPTPRVEVADLDGDLRDEARLVSAQVAAYVELDEGGAVYELDFRPKRFNVLNVLSRRPEGYHRKLANAAHISHGGDDVQSIHDMTVVKSDGLTDLLVYDAHPRHAFIDHFYAPDVSWEDIVAGHAVERGDFAGGRYQLVAQDSTSVQLRRAGRIDGRPAAPPRRSGIDASHRAAKSKHPPSSWSTSGTAFSSASAPSRRPTSCAIRSKPRRSQRAASNGLTRPPS
jgi:alpha-amylase